MSIACSPRHVLASVLYWLLSAGLAQAAEAPADPLKSPSWKSMHQRYIGKAPMQFDARVRVQMPTSAEDPMQVPVMVSADGLEGVEEILVFADLNPLPKILQYWPHRAAPRIGFRFKVEQSTPVRAAMRTRDGVWHVGGAWLSAAGGGCTAPSAGTSQGLWQDRLGEVSARLWPRHDGFVSERLRLRVIHPMDTGLAAGIPVFHIDRIDMRDAAGALLASLQTFEPLSENPVISVDLQGKGSVRIDGADIQGNRFSARVTP